MENDPPASQCGLQGGASLTVYALATSVSASGPSPPKAASGTGRSTARQAPPQLLDAGAVPVGVGVADFLLVGSADLQAYQGGSKIALLLIRKAEVPTCLCLAAAVADLSRNSQSLFVKLDSPLWLTLVGVSQAQIVQDPALTTAVADLPSNGEVLLVQLNGPLRLTQVGGGRGGGGYFFVAKKM